MRRSNKHELLHSRKQMDNDKRRGHRDKDKGAQHSEKDDNLKSHYGNLDELHSKRRKNEEYLRNGHADKEEIFYSHKESTRYWKREKDVILDWHKRDNQPRISDNLMMQRVNQMQREREKKKVRNGQDAKDKVGNPYQDKE